MEILEITGEKFKEEVIDYEKPVIVDFFATWCGPCKVQSAIMEEIAQTEEDVKIVKIDVDQNQELAEKYEIMSIPTVIIIKNGIISKEFVGTTQKEELLEAYKSALIQ